MSVPKKDLIKARRVAAQVVRQLGDRYWPIFEMLDQEIEKIDQRDARIKSCLHDPPRDQQHQ
ncbi:MAG: hypothetical protein AAFX77_07990 [Pseudomonadota bacterium]